MIEPDKIKRLQELQGKLIDVFLDEGDPGRWVSPADGLNWRGDRYWDKRNAGATATLIVKVQTIIDQQLRTPTAAPTDPTPGDEREDEISEGKLAAEAMAEAERIIESARNTRFGSGKKKGKK